MRSWPNMSRIVIRRQFHQRQSAIPGTTFITRAFKARSSVATSRWNCCLIVNCPWRSHRTEGADAAYRLNLLRQEWSVGSRRRASAFFLTAALYLRGNRGTLPRPAGFSNRVGSPPTQPGGLLWLWERLGWFAVVFAATESCEERDSPGIRPCGVTPAWPLFGGGRGRLEGTRRPLIAQYAGHTGGRPICATAATLGLFRSAATKLAN
jgi:hypothetical protein